jgi:hypothetical protein
MKDDAGGPAFPRPMSEDRSSGSMQDGDYVVGEQDGMFLVDYFAAKAMQGLVASGVQNANVAANVAWDIAERMIVERRHRGVQ